MTETQTNVTVNQTTENTSIIYLWKIPIDKTFVTSINSILQVSAAGLSLIAFICVASGRSDDRDESYSSTYNFFEFVSISTFVTLLFCWMFYALAINKRLFIRRIPWILVDLIYCAVYIVLYFIATTILAAETSGKDNNKAACVFGFLAMLCLVGNGIFQLITLRSQKTSSLRTQTPQKEDKNTEENKEKF